MVTQMKEQLEQTLKETRAQMWILTQKEVGISNQLVALNRLEQLEQAEQLEQSATDNNIEETEGE